MRALYSVLWWLLLPAVAAYLLWRSRRQPEYRAHWRERFAGRGATPRSGRDVVWLHAVSVGETRAAEPLLTALLARQPQLDIVLTHMTPTGRAVGAELAARWPGRIVVRYLPYELAPALRNFFAEVRPRAGLIMETELWPNLMTAAQRAAVPMVLVNARLSEKSLAQALRFAALLRPAAAGFAAIAAQSAADCARIARLYNGPIEVVGNLKFDLAPDPVQVDAGRALRDGRPTLLFASSREGEEALLLAALRKLEPDPNSFGLWIVPRHPQRFDEVAALIESHGARALRRSTEKMGSGSNFGLDGAHAIGLGDTMGEMALHYARAELTLMGGSFLPFGSQNLIESCAVGTPVIVGPSTFNFSQAAADAIAAGAALQVATMDDALTTAAALLRDPARLARMRAAAQSFAAAHRGATERTLRVIERVLDATDATAPAAR